MRGPLLTASALAFVLTIACGGESTTAPEETQSGATRSTRSEATASATEQPTPVEAEALDEEWAYEQVTPVLKESAEALLAEEFNKFYDLMAESSRETCSRSEFVSNFAGTWLLAQGFGAEEVLEAILQDIEDGTLQLTFSEISEARITYQLPDDDESETVVRENGDWRFLDDGTCGGSGASTTCVDKWDSLVEEWNSVPRSDPETFEGFMAERGYPATFEEFQQAEC